ncbi:MAG: hypothetical protein AAFV07_16755 [Bacteroidota bacterium]
MPEQPESASVNYYAREEISDMIGNPPSWLMRSGISMVGLVLVSVLIITNYISYPDKIKGMGMLTSESPPIELMSKTTGYIDTLLVTPHQKVSQGAPILYIKNPALPADIAQLEEWMALYAKARARAAYSC